MANLNLQDKKFISPENLRLIINYGLGFASRVKNLEDKEIAPFEADKLYTKDSLTIYDGYIYKAKVTNQSSTFNEIYWDLIGDDITELSKADVEAMVGLSAEEIETLSKIILDSEIRLDKTYSSSKIYTDIQNAIQTSKDYTLTELSKMSGASYKVVTSTSEMTSESIIYLLANATNYDMYIIEEDGTATKIGDTAINLDNYFTKTEITDNYYDKATCDGKFATITTVDNHIGDTTIHITQEEKDSLNTLEKDKLVTADDVTDTIDINSSGTKIPNVKAIYNDIIEGKNIDQTVIDTCGTDILKYPLGIWRIGSDSIANNFTDLPVKTSGHIEITSIDANTNKNPWNSSWSYRTYNFKTYTGANYFRKITSAHTAGNISDDTGWQKVCTTKVDDVGITTITPASSNVTGTIKYTVKNGICYVSFKGVKSTTNGTFSISTTMPKSDISCSIGIISDVANYDTGCAYIDENTTKLNITFYSTNYAGSCSFSYPVAES